MTVFLMTLAACGGFALCWFAKDNIMVMATGTESFIQRLEAKARALKAAL